MKKILSFVLAAIMCMALLAGCGSSDNSGDKKVIKMGGNGLYAANVEILSELMKDKYDIQLVNVDSNSGCVEGAVHGSIDCFMYNHIPWLKQYNESNGTDFVVIEPVFYTRMALYSDKYDKLEDLPDGATIAICNDSVNMENNLVFLEQLGLIKLGEKAEGESFLTTLDVIENPKNIKFQEVEISYAVRSLEDCDAAICTATYVLTAGKDPNKFLAEYEDKKNFPIGLTVLKKNENEQWVADIMETLKSDEFAAEFNKQFQGAMVLVVKK